MEKEIVELVYMAKGDSLRANDLIVKYLPYIKSQTSKVIGRLVVESDDEFSIAMIGFHEAIESYSKSRGGFLKYASLVMKNKIMDFYRSEKRHRGKISMEESLGWDGDLTFGDTIEDKLDQYSQLATRNATMEEIDELAKQLEEYQLSFTKIADNTPKQKRTLESCRKILAYSRQEKSIMEEVLKSKKLPIKKLSQVTGISPKTIERHRDYLMSLIIIYSNGYEIIRGHIKQVLSLEGEGGFI